MGDSEAWEALEGRTEPPTFRELFTVARYRQDALRIIQSLELKPARERQVRRKLAEAQRPHKRRRQSIQARPDVERATRLILAAEQALTSSLRHFDPRFPPHELVVIRNTLRSIALSARPWRGKTGAPKLPYAAKALIDLDLDDLGLDESDARTLLRAMGIHLSTGRPPRR